MQKSLYFSLSILLFFAALSIVSKVEKKTGTVIEKVISSPKNDFDTISDQLTRLVWSVLDSSGGDLYSMNKSINATLFFSPLNINGKLEFKLNPMVFSRKKNVSSVQEAFELQRTIYQQLLPKLNNLRCLRPYLSEFPLTPDSFSILISFSENVGIHPHRPYFTSLIIRHLPRDPGRYFGLTQYVDTKKEDRQPLVPFQDVFRIPCGQVPGLQPFYKMKVDRSPAPKNSWLLVNTLPSYGGVWARVVYDFAPFFCPQHNLRLVVQGAVEKDTCQRAAFGFVFTGLHKLSLDDARKLATDCAAHFLTYVKQRIETDEEVKKYFIRNKKLDPNSNLGNVPTLRDFSFRLSFWDENVDRRESPYIAEVRMFGQTFQYFTSDEGQHLVPVFEESVEDGMKFWRENNKHS